MKATIGAMLSYIKENKKRTELKISGMNCAICATTIEKSILSLEGDVKDQAEHILGFCVQYGSHSCCSGSTLSVFCNELC